MRNSGRLSFLMVAAVAVCLAVAAPVVTFAEGGPKPAASPKPDSQKKIWTNDDVVRLDPAFDANRPKQTTAAASAASSARSIAVAARVQSALPALRDPQQEPQWYAQQLDPLEAELAGIENREAQLRQFRATSAGLPTGLVLGAPCEGITTDNLIAQLDARRQEILQQIDALGDTAQRNDMLPGILVEGRGRAHVASESTAAEERAAVARQARDASDELAQIRGTVAGMQEQLSAQGITLLRPAPGEGGSMTTDLLDQLDGRASALQNEISDAEDSARNMGIPPGDLR
ncbi:MAG: hypothetical protein P4L00_08420 [Candidatus Acidoferrales bacterium]|nr:hypothetical protein [Candidatus Acidoferrales bacterium]